MDERQEHFDALLAGYVAGTLAEPARLLVRSHLDLSPVNRGFVRDLEATCGSMLEGVAPMSLENRDAMLAAIFDTPLGERIAAPPAPPRDTRLPAALADFIGKDIADLPWKTKLPGLREYKVAEMDGCTASLLWIRAGMAMPTHTHHGTELTLVVEGGFSDGEGHYVRGDVAYADDHVDHRPVADEGEDCICFAVTEGSLRLTGPIGRFFAPFLRG
ncbi:ChrR family anti-sigma-E factor [Stappia sp. MMSF_3263]|uniref:ChrR family anti-sigma-E factor n=1 Tax=Stappia sp. MMSF_3263 TaxID=3046693 RepID=UPI00273D5B61|nr:ChrR family anti-sigma-E factor [Stappia sp. MMSF_3263]